MQIGRYQISVHNHGFFRLDGGAMFGSIPKTLWGKVAPADDENRILLATRSLIVEEGARKLIVDLGNGDKWNEKARGIFCFPDGPYSTVPHVTDVLLTHLHFDHAGGVSRSGSDGLEANYPSARHYVSRPNLENARDPHPREQASYLKENVDVLDSVDLHLLQDKDEVWPGITVHRADGHTRGLMWVEIKAGDAVVAFPTDLMPTSAHVPVAYVMGYDMCAEQAMAEKAAFLKRAISEEWIVVFEHDPSLAAARLGRDERGRAAVAEPIEIESQ